MVTVVGLGELCLKKSGHYAMLLSFLLLATMLWVVYYYAPLTGCYAWNLISTEPSVYTIA